MRVFVFHVCDALIAEQTSVPVGVPRQAFEFLQWGLYSAVGFRFCARAVIDHY